MGRTPDRSPWSPAFQNEIILEDRTVDGDPTALGAVRLVNGEIRGVDTLGVYNFRGLNDAEHELLDTLVHGIAEPSHTKYAYTGRLLTNITVFDPTLTTKIREFVISYISRRRFDQVIAIQYDAAGVELRRLILDFTYAGRLLTDVILTSVP